MTVQNIFIDEAALKDGVRAIRFPIIRMLTSNNSKIGSSVTDCSCASSSIFKDSL